LSLPVSFPDPLPPSPVVSLLDGLLIVLLLELCHQYVCSLKLTVLLSLQ